MTHTDICLCTWFESHKQNTKHDYRDHQIQAKA
jgi:hypothetical protein